MNKLQLSTLFIGRNFIHLPICHSTNSYALDLLQTNPTLFEGTLVLTDTQTAGRGQQGNTWEAEPYQNFTLSVVLKPTFLPASMQFYLNMSISLAVFDFLYHFIPGKLAIKWSNDIFYDKQKICGMLIENSIRKNVIDATVVGLGININQQIFDQPKAVSLRNITQKSYYLLDILPLLCEKLEQNYLLLKSGNFEAIQRRYLTHLYLLNQLSYFYNKPQNIYFEGTIRGINEVGKLLVEVNNQIQTFDFKEIVFL